jgi:hypothetical protein
MRAADARRIASHMIRSSMIASLTEGPVRDWIT